MLYPLFLFMGTCGSRSITILLDSPALQNPYMDFIIKLYQIESRGANGYYCI